MGKEWKAGIDESPRGDPRLWTDSGSATVHVYRLRLGWREYYFTRGEILLTLFVGLFVGLIYAAGQAGYLKLPERTRLGHYQPPEPRLLGSTERTRPEAGDPDAHFVDARGRAAVRPSRRAEEAASADAPELSNPPAQAQSEQGGGTLDPEPVT